MNRRIRDGIGADTLTPYGIALFRATEGGSKPVSLPQGRMMYDAAERRVRENNRALGLKENGFGFIVNNGDLFYMIVDR